MTVRAVRSNDPRDLTIGLIAEILEIDPATIRGTDRLREDLGMDSLGSLELLSSIGAELNIDLEVEEAMDIQTVDDACAFVARKMAMVRENAPTERV